jgi:hypothetical protein
MTILADPRLQLSLLEMYALALLNGEEAPKCTAQHHGEG